MDVEIKGALDGIRGTVESFKAQQDAMQRQLDAVDANTKERHGGSPNAPVSLVQKLKESDQFQRLMHDKKGTAVLTLTGKDAAAFIERKTTLLASSTGYQTTGVYQIERLPEITPEARQTLTVRDALFARPTQAALVDFVKVQNPMAIASPVAEGSTMAENAVTFTSHSELIKTVATWIPASRQALDDYQELATFVDGSLRYYLRLEEELQLLSGTGTGNDLNGLITQATPFNTGLLSATAGWNRIDIIGRAIEQITTAKEIQPTFVVMNPTDWWSIRLTKDGFGRYILGDPQTTARAGLFDLTVVPTVSIASGTFLVGSGNPVASEIVDRLEMTVELSTQHSTYFTQGLVAIRAEERLALVVRRPASYVYGSFTTSPAGQ